MDNRREGTGREKGERGKEKREKCRERERWKTGGRREMRDGESGGDKIETERRDG